MADFIPQSDAEFDNWQANFLLYAANNVAALGLTPAQIAQLNTVNANWTDSYADHQAMQTAAAAAVQTKNARRATYVDLIRTLTALIQANPAVTDTQRAALGITVPGSAPTPIGPPTTQPVLSVDMGTRLMHVVSFADAGTPTSVAKPAGVMGCELWQKIDGPAPVNNEGMTFLALDTRTPYTVNFDAAAVGKTVYYLGRWVSTTAEQGPWSTVIAATVGG